MKRAIVLISHGNIAVEMKRSVQMIAGASNHIYCVTLHEIGLVDFEKQWKDVMQQIEVYERVIVFADLYGCLLYTSMINR